MIIYVVEDDESILKLMEYALKSKGYEVRCFESGAEFFKALLEQKPHLILLDIMLPDIDGLEILKKLKSHREYEDIWTMMITAKNTEFDIISALDLGADDYLKKPFSVLELLSRVNAMGRRLKKGENREDTLEFQGIVMDNLRRKVSIDGHEVDFTFKEFELLKYLILNKEIVLSREKLLEYIWGYDYEGETRTVDMHIKLLRDKLGQRRDYIKTIRGVGYMLSAKE